MNRYAILCDQRAGLQDELEAIAGKAERSEAEAMRGTELVLALGKLDSDIGSEKAIMDALVRQPGTGPVSRVHDREEAKPWGFDYFGMGPAEFIAQSPHSYLSLENPKHPRNVYMRTGFGEFLQAVAKARLGHGSDVRLFSAATGAGESVGADGGFLVPTEMADDILLRAVAGEVWSRVKRRTLGVANSIEINVVDETNRATGSRHGGVQGYWVDEGTAPTASKPKFAKLSFKPRKLAALGYATDELLADAALIQGIMFDAFVDELKFLTEDSIINGTGVGQPKGLLNENAKIEVSKETGQAASTIVTKNLSKMWARLFARNRANAVWLINQDIEPQLDELAFAVGTGGLEPRFITYGPEGTLRIRNKPVIPVEYCATLGTVGDIILADLGEYWLFDKGEPQRASSMHVAFTTDEMAFRVTYRVDGALSWRSVLTPFKGTSNTVAPVVTLATRA